MVQILTQFKFLQLRPIEGRSQCAGPSVRDLVEACRKRAERGRAQEGATEGRSHIGTESQLPKKGERLQRPRRPIAAHPLEKERLTQAQRRWLRVEALTQQDKQQKHNVNRQRETEWAVSGTGPQLRYATAQA